MDAMTEDHERATGPWEIEWIVLPEVFTLAAGALSQARTILSGLNVDPERMRANLDLSRGLIVSEAVMMGLAPYLGRERSHDLVYDICSEVSAGNGIFLDPANYLGMAPHMVHAVLEINHKEKGKL